MTPPQQIDGDGRNLWAVCPQPDGQISDPEWFRDHDTALAYKDAVIFPATVEGPLLPPTERVSDEALAAHLHGIAIHGPVCGVAIRFGGRARVPVRIVERVDSCGYEWMVFEREDGKEWFAIDDNEICGVGAFRKTDGPVSSISPHEYPRGYRRATHRFDQNILDLIPIKWLGDFEGPHYHGMRFSEYLPAEDFVGRPSSGCGSADELAAKLREGFETGSPALTCELGDDWQFKTIETEAIDLPAYRFKAREIKGQSYQLALIAHALEETLFKHHSAMPAEAVASFWTSWPVWNHFSNWSLKIKDELQRRRAQYDDSTRISHALQHQAWSYGRMVRVWRKGCTQSLPEAPAHNRQEASLSSEEPTAVSALDSAGDIGATPSQAETTPLWARNLTALWCESKLSIRGLARLVGPGDGDPKAVAAHCKGRRVPEDRTLAIYAEAFSRRLKRRITADQIRNANLTARSTDSSV